MLFFTEDVALAIIAQQVSLPSVRLFSVQLLLYCLFLFNVICRRCPGTTSKLNLKFVSGANKNDLF